MEENNHPNYYCRDIVTADGKKTRIEVWDIIRAWNLDPARAFAVKYVLRAGYKDAEKEMQDIDKAINCLCRERVEIMMREKEGKKNENG